MRLSNVNVISSFILFKLFFATLTYKRYLHNNGYSEVFGTYQLFGFMSSDIGDITIRSPESFNGSSL